MEAIRTITREFKTGERAVLHVESRSGAVLVEADDGDTVRVEATLHLWTDNEREADDAATEVADGMEQNEHRVIIRAPKVYANEGRGIWVMMGMRSSRIDYHVQVPRATATRVLSRSGRVQVSGVHARVHVEAASGRTGVSGALGDVTVVSRSGAVAIEHVEGDVTVEARSGRLEVRDVTGCAKVESRSGAVEIRNVSGDVSVTARTGSVSIDQARSRVYARAHTGQIRFSGRIEGDMDLKAHTGLIQLAVDTERPFFIDAESDLGAVRSELPPRRGAPPTDVGGGAQAPKVRLRTHTGMIRLTRL